MATIPTTSAYSVGEKPTAVKLNANQKTAVDFLLNPPAGAWERNATQTFTNTTFADITWDTEEFDTDSMWTSGASITINTPGLWLVIGSASFASNATGARRVQILKNGTAVAVSSHQAPGASSPAKIQIARLMRFASGDTVKLQGYQSSGANLDSFVTGNEWRPRLELVWRAV